jgi:hydrogenase maturation protein HypF
MLPYSPLHYLLVQDFGRPLVATSANVSGEPVLTENRDVEARLAHVADTFLHHDRPIQRPADDPVFRSIGERPRPIRLGRGCAPCELPSPVPLPHPVLAVGAHMKNTVALGWDERIVVSPHIGDMATARSRAVFEQVVEDLQSLYGVQARAVVCDAHRGYTSSRWAHSCGLPLTRVYHHHAHAAALVGEGRLDEDWLVFTWDGVGLGPDGTLWGGEALLGGPGRWERVGSLRPFRLPGGEKVAREPWRSAMGLCWEGGQSWEQCPQDPTLLHHAWQRGLNCPKTSAVGRLFDGAAALVGLLSHASFEGQGPMLLESAADEAGRSIELPVLRDDSGLWILDWQPLLENLMDRRRTLGARAATFHSSLAAALVQLALRIRASHGVDRVGLCGGVFQNRRLVRILVDSLQGRGFAVQIPEQLPVNDASISFGQVIEYAFAGADH